MKKIALVTGAAGGLGQAMASKLASDRWALIVTGRDCERLARAYGNRHLQIVANCSTVAGVRHIFDAAGVQELQPDALAHWVCNTRLGAMHGMPDKDFMDCLHANLIGAFRTLSTFVGDLREHNAPGAAVLVSSAAARIGTPNHEPSPLPRAVLKVWCAVRRRPMRQRRSESTLLRPASWTRLLRGVSCPARLREPAARQYPLSGIGSANELAELMVWLLSHSAARVTGHV